MVKSLTDGKADDAQSRLERLSRRDNSSSHGNFEGYSRFVRLMRLALPLAALAVIVVVFVRTGEKPAGIVPVPLEQQGVAVQDMKRNELLNPEFKSMDKKGQPYKITAARAVQGEVNKDLVMLDKPVGVMTMSDGQDITIRSNSGAYRQDTERFFLQGGVSLEHARGYVLKSSEAHMDLRNGFAWSEKPVNGTGPDVVIDASGLRANAKTGEIVFTGPAKLTLESGFKGFK